MCAVPLHVIWAWLIVGKWGFGYLGAAFALNITYLSLCIAIFVYSSRIEAIKEAWFISSAA